MTFTTFLWDLHGMHITGSWAWAWGLWARFQSKTVCQYHGRICGMLCEHGRACGQCSDKEKVGAAAGQLGTTMTDLCACALGWVAGQVGAVEMRDAVRKRHAVLY